VGIELPVLSARDTSSGSPSSIEAGADIGEVRAERAALAAERRAERQALRAERAPAATQAKPRKRSENLDPEM